MTHLTDSQLNEYLDDALGAGDRRAAAAHLEACPACRAELEALRTVFTALGGLPERTLARDLSEPVLAALPGTVTPSLGWRLALATQAGAALGVLIVLGRAVAPRFDPAAAAEELARQIFTGWALALPALPRLAMPDLTLPHFVPPSLPLPAGGGELGLLAIAAGILWIVGNASLMRDRAEERRK